MQRSTKKTRHGNTHTTRTDHNFAKQNCASTFCCGFCLHSPSSVSFQRIDFLFYSDWMNDSPSFYSSLYYYDCCCSVQFSFLLDLYFSLFSYYFRLFVGEFANQSVFRLGITRFLYFHHSFSASESLVDWNLFFSNVHCHNDIFYIKPHEPVKLTQNYFFSFFYFYFFLRLFLFLLRLQLRFNDRLAL